MSVLLMTAFVTVLLFMSAAWAVYLVTKRAAIVDVAWALSIILLAYFYVIMTGTLHARALLLLLMVTLASGRLAFLLYDRLRKGLHDRRYDVLTKKFEGREKLSYLFFFLFQGCASFVLSIPFAFVALSDKPLGLLDGIALLLFIFAFYLQVKSDQIIHRFRQNPNNRHEVCREGPWGWTRHPNYFSEWLIWISYALLALSAPYGWLGVISPLLMYYFVTRVTGIPPTEEVLLQSKGEKYREYQRSVPAFFPRIGRRGDV